MVAVALAFSMAAEVTLRDTLFQTRQAGSENLLRIDVGMGTSFPYNVCIVYSLQHMRGRD